MSIVTSAGRVLLPPFATGTTCLRSRHMTVASPSVALADSQLARLLHLATRAPSAGNMQPWRFRRAGAELEVVGFGGGEVSALDHEGRATALTLGGLLEYLAIAATAVHFTADVALEADPTRAGRWATIRFEPRAGAPDPLAAALAARCTDRRDYLGGAVTDPVFAAIADDCGQYPECRLYLRGRDEYTDDLLAYVAASERFFWTCKPVQQQVMKVVRWSAEEAAATRDGVLWEALGLGKTAARVLELSSRWPVQQLLNRLGFLAAVDRLTYSALRSAAGLGLITVRRPARAAFVAAAGLHTRAWLRLHAAGYALQPFTGASLYAADAEDDRLPREWPDDQRRVFAPGMAVLRRAFDFPADETPVWLFRAGRSPGPLDRARWTHRYDVTHVLRDGRRPVSA